MPEYRDLVLNIKSATYLVLEEFGGGEMSRNRCRQHQDQGFISIALERANVEWSGMGIV